MSYPVYVLFSAPEVKLAPTNATVTTAVSHSDAYSDANDGLRYRQSKAYLKPDIPVLLDDDALSSGRSTPLPQDAPPSMKSIHHAKKQKRRKLFPTVNYEERVSHFDPQSQHRDFRGFFTLFWVGLFIMVLTTGARNVKETGRVFRTSIFSLFTEDLQVLALSDLLMVASTSLTLPLHLNWRKRPFNVGWGNGGYVCQYILQLVWLAMWVFWPFARGWVWTHQVFFTLHTLVLLMKMHSYAFYNGHLCETERKLHQLDKNTLSTESKADTALREVLAYELTSPTGMTQYPKNLTWSNYVDYLLCPTLCYEIEYPRTPKMRDASARLQQQHTVSDALLVLGESINLLLFPFMVSFLLVFLVIFEASKQYQSEGSSDEALLVSLFTTVIGGIRATGSNFRGSGIYPFIIGSNDTYVFADDDHDIFGSEGDGRSAAAAPLPSQQQAPTTETENLLINLSIEDTEKPPPPRRPSPGVNPENKSRGPQQRSTNGPPRPSRGPPPPPFHSHKGSVESSSKPVSSKGNPPQKRKEEGKVGSGRQRSNSESSAMDVIDRERERERERRKEKSKREGDEKNKDEKSKKSSDRRKRAGAPLDIIDKLDVTGIYGGGLFHHDGPFDACNPHRNKNKNRAPMQAFPEGSKNNVLGGFDFDIKTNDHSHLFGNRDPEAYLDFAAGRRGSAADDVYDATRPSSKRTQSFDPINRPMIHGDESLGLGTSTFLEGTPATKKAIEKAQAEEDIMRPTTSAGYKDSGGLQRKKSLAQKFRGIGSQKPTSGDAIDKVAPGFDRRHKPTKSNSPTNDGYPERPFTPTSPPRGPPPVNRSTKATVSQARDDDYDSAWDKKGESIQIAEDERRTNRDRAPSHPGLGRTTSDNKIYASSNPGTVDQSGNNGILKRNLFDLLGNDIEDENETPKAPLKEIVKKTTSSKKVDTATPQAATSYDSGRSGAGRRPRGEGNDAENVGTGPLAAVGREEAEAANMIGTVPLTESLPGFMTTQTAGSLSAIRSDTDKQVSQGWGSNKGNSEWNDEQAGETIAQAEVTDDTAAPAAADGEGQAEAADATEPVPEPEEDKTKSFAQYLQEQESRAPVEELPEARRANEGARDNKKWATAKELVKEEDEEYFSGGKYKSKNQKQRKEKNVVEIDHGFVDPRSVRRSSGDRGGRGGRGGMRGDRPPRGGRGEYRGGRGGARGGFNVSDESAFPSLGGK
ncbi:hypothetical protein Dda_6459 [Drechslerella dactyloides]|uniref:Hyaluronan/mRNA-binding protein domain-containing protein n=1 Tax=Drechslerella dactyloides TaxID=74499 RepID=A0AAD6ITL8_DREDA|nr:hypothetical protein Dda_6459 [Drechslerella dactyloides]